VEPRETNAAEHKSSVRCTIEQFHCERRQFTGVRAGTCLKQASYQTQQAVYQPKKGFLDDLCDTN